MKDCGQDWNYFQFWLNTHTHTVIQPTSFEYMYMYLLTLSCPVYVPTQQPNYNVHVYPTILHNYKHQSTFNINNMMKLTLSSNHLSWGDLNICTVQHNFLCRLRNLRTHTQRDNIEKYYFFINTTELQIVLLIVPDVEIASSAATVMCTLTVISSFPWKVNAARSGRSSTL